jgi:ABC-type polysaccharide/polyol phosphate transport system ATPase subunit
MSENVAIKVVGLGKRFERSSVDESTGLDDATGFWALRNVSFEIKKGESVGIIGPNGSGKSTLLKILAGVTRPTEGRVEINGRVASILEIGSGFHPELTGRENIYLNGSILGFSKKEITPHVDSIIEFSGINDFIDEPVKNYSSGMYVRLAFSIMAHLPFDIYLLDEVLSVGDEEFQNKCWENVKKWKNMSKTIILVHHNMLLAKLITTKEYNLGEMTVDIGHITKNVSNSDKLHNEDCHFNVCMGSIDEVFIPTKYIDIKSIQETLYLLYVVSTSGVNLAVSELFTFNDIPVKNGMYVLSPTLKLTKGVYFLILAYVIDDSYHPVINLKLDIKENKNLYANYPSLNSVLLIESIIGKKNGTRAN